MTRRASGSALNFLHTGFDERIECRYLLMTMSVGEFLNLVRPAYDAQGLIEGQRDVVRTASATRIRRRMADDLQKGAIIPPIVLGVTADQKRIQCSSWDTKSLRDLLRSLKTVSIIDGMQRTSVLLDNENALADRELRVELWLAPKTENLVYRMLVLNTGQIPWNLRRQLEVVHHSLIDEIRASLSDVLSIHKADDKRRRTVAGEFQGNDVVEMYLAFNLRKPHVDKESVLADQFSKLDLIEAVSDRRSFELFVRALRDLVALDKQFERAKDPTPDKAKYSSGRHIFDKVSACAGFMAAYAQYVLGRVGMNRSQQAAEDHLNALQDNCNAVIRRLEQMKDEEIAEFLALATLREVSSKPGGALSIGEAERELFLAAFKLLFEEGRDLNNMEPCWRSQ